MPDGGLRSVPPPWSSRPIGDDRIYGDHGLTSTIRQRTGLRLALAACWAGDTLVRDQRGDLLLSGAEVVAAPGLAGKAVQPCSLRWTSTGLSVL